MVSLRRTPPGPEAPFPRGSPDLFLKVARFSIYKWLSVISPVGRMTMRVTEPRFPAEKREGTKHHWLSPLSEPHLHLQGLTLNCIKQINPFIPIQWMGMASGHLRLCPAVRSAPSATQAPGVGPLLESSRHSPICRLKLSCYPVGGKLQWVGVGGFPPASLSPARLYYLPATSMF